MDDKALLLREFAEGGETTQRALAETLGWSLGKTNQLVAACTAEGLLAAGEGQPLALTAAGRGYLEPFKVDNAIILAAGFGSRFVPLTYDTPKGLLAVHGKPMLERQIEQLLEKGVTEIILVVGYMKEKFDYLIDRYGVKLVFNPDYATKNNLFSLQRALPWLKNSYLLCADNWIEENIFHRYEAGSWFSCLYQEGPTAEWCVKTAKNGKIERIDIGGQDAYAVVGPAFFTRDFSATFAGFVQQYGALPKAADWYWEHVLREELAHLPLFMNVQTGNVYEFEDLEELRRYDKSYINETNSRIMQCIAAAFSVPEGEIGGIFPLKEGLTNSSFHFAIDADEYVFRLPGTGTEKLINRRNEKGVYDQIQKLGITDEVVYFDADTGIKITRYYKDIREADPFDDGDLAASMQMIARVHQSGMKVPNGYDIGKMIGYYLALAKEEDAIRFADFDETHEKMRRLLALRERLAIPEVLCHGDYAHTNVLIFPNGAVKLIDWEYGGMGDPIMDVAMYSIFAEFGEERVELALRDYLGREPQKEETARMYLYVALGGFLWSLWSQYKQALGQEFGEYPLVMYRYMKDYYKKLEKLGL